jgi:hypothetical protein
MAPGEFGGYLINGTPERFYTEPQDEGLPQISLQTCDDRYITERLLPPQPVTGFSWAQVARTVGWEPREWLVVDGNTSAHCNHLLVGRVATELAERYGGVIEFGAYPPSSDTIRYPDLPQTTDELHRRWNERVRRWVASMPGKAYELLDAEGTIFTHVVDHVFMKAWLRHPEFYIG